MKKRIRYGLLTALALALALGVLPIQTAQLPVAEANPGTQWNASYFNNRDLSGSPVVTRVDDFINFNWASGSPDPAVPTDNFSARWTKTVNFPVGGTWNFRVGADDGVRMWIDQTVLVDQWHGTPSGYTTYTATLSALTAGPHDLRVEYYEETGFAGVQVTWEGPGTTTPAGQTQTAAGTTAADTTVKVWASVTATRLNVRSGPGTGNPVIAQVEYPDNYVVRAAVHDLSWVLIDLEDGREGWVSNEWVYLWAADSTLNQDADGDTYQDFVFMIPRVDTEVLPGKFTPVDKPLVPVKGRVNDHLNLRDGPTSFASQVIATVPVGSIVDIEARSGNGAWYLANYQGIRGWLSAAFVSLTEGRVSDLLVSTEVVPVPPAGQVFFPADEQGNPAVTVRGRAVSNLNFRSGATLTAEQIGRVPQGTEFVVEARNRNGAWYLITYEGQPGWVNAAYVTLIEGRVADLPVQ